MQVGRVRNVAFLFCDVFALGTFLVFRFPCVGESKFRFTQFYMFYLMVAFFAPPRRIPAGQIFSYRSTHGSARGSPARAGAGPPPHWGVARAAVGQRHTAKVDMQGLWTDSLDWLHEYFTILILFGNIWTFFMKKYHFQLSLTLARHLAQMSIGVIVSCYFCKPRIAKSVKSKNSHGFLPKVRKSRNPHDFHFF